MDTNEVVWMRQLAVIPLDDPHFRSAGLESDPTVLLTSSEPMGFDGGAAGRLAGAGAAASMIDRRVFHEKPTSMFRQWMCLAVMVAGVAFGGVVVQGQLTERGIDVPAEVASITAVAPPSTTVPAPAPVAPPG